MRAKDENSDFVSDAISTARRERNANQDRRAVALVALLQEIRTKQIITAYNAIRPWWSYYQTAYPVRCLERE